MAELYGWTQAVQGGSPITLNSNPLLTGNLRAVGVGNYVVGLLNWEEQSYKLQPGSLDSATWWAIVDLHELGHAKGGLANDGGNTKLSNDNTQTVIDNCFKGLKQ